MIQDGTKNVLKHKSKSGMESFLEHKKLIELCMEKFNPDVCVVCEIPPLKNVEQYQDKNEKMMKSIILLHHTILINHPSRYPFFMLILKR